MTPPPRRWGIVVVRGRSMLPTLRDGDRLLVRYGQLPQVGAIGVVRFDDVLAVKRLSLNENDEWWFSRDNAAEGVDSWTRGMPSVTSDVLATAVMRLWPRPKRM